MAPGTDAGLGVCTAMDDRAPSTADDDVEVPLPRRGPRRSRIVDARQRLYGDSGPDAGDGPQRWTDVEGRERSAALARSATARRQAPAAQEQPADADDGPAVEETPPDPPVDRPAPARGTPDTPHARPSRRRVPARLVAAVVLALVVGIVVGIVVAPSDDVPVATPPAPSRPVLGGDVVRVIDGGRLTVLVDDRPVEVAVLGLDPPRAEPNGLTSCGADTATAFAADNLAGRRVTLVPDAVGAEFDPDGRRWAYVVLATQQNYTDLALLQGIGRWDTTRTLTYGEVFAREEAEARRASAGIWGAPCRATP